MLPGTTTRADPSRHLDYFMPLEFFYAHAGQRTPAAAFLDGADMPEPYRYLLVHESDMTPRLAEFHRAEIGLEVIDAQRSEHFVMRLVILNRMDTGKPVEFGAIGIQLDGFNPETREEIRSGAAPLGGILARREITHQSRPKAYFSIKVDDFMARLLHEEPGTKLYGRCNALSHPDGIVFADIVEILPRCGPEAASES